MTATLEPIILFAPPVNGVTVVPGVPGALTLGAELPEAPTGEVPLPAGNGAELGSGLAWTGERPPVLLDPPAG